MIIFEKKTKSMIINFTNNYQFGTRLSLNNTNLEIVNQMTILGTIITDKLKWDENCDMIIAKVNKRMLLLKKVLSFGATREEMVHLWIIYCRSYLEQCATVWSSSLSQENKEDLERTQKSFAKLILKQEYTNYETALLKLNLQTLEQRRRELCLNFAKDSIKNEVLDDLFPTNYKENSKETRNREKYAVTHANTDRLRNSSIIYMQNLLNEEYQKEKSEN